MPGWIEPMKYGRDSRTYLGHTFRYYLAGGFLRRSDIVVDLGCGCGYGSVILARTCGQVLGYDCDEEALAKARSTYHVAGRTRAELIDLETTESLPNCDVIVCFETIEHIENPERVAALMRKHARRLIIMSTPWRDTKSPHHKRAFFTERELYDMFQDDEWALWEIVKQGPYHVAIFYRKGTL